MSREETKKEFHLSFELYSKDGECIKMPESGNKFQVVYLTLTIKSTRVNKQDRVDNHRAQEFGRYCKDSRKKI